uniref:Uncharacterized protein n=1 Tax=Rousettus aegyptiacus TaxID=9407 RepID=A0A7J8CD66_ROUAE|nr:hypothetical protein HJG63_000118 [Rousettus aegyptiacus]
MGCHSSKNTEVVGEPQKPQDQTSAEEPNLEAGTEVADGKDAPVKDGSPEPRS